MQPSCLRDDASTFNICLDLKGTSGATEYENWMDDFARATQMWEGVLVGDVPSASGTDAATSRPTSCSQYPATIDDLYICGLSVPMDGVGNILGSAGPMMIRRDTGLPITGEMRFDKADIIQQRQFGTFGSIIQHEMGHVLGLGTMWPHFGLYDGFSGRYKSGTHADNEWKAIGCTGPLPVELDGGAGTAGGHWDELCVRNELMTGFSTGSLPLSRITIASLEDMGYQVNYGAAQAFGLNQLGSCGSYCPAAGRRHLRSQVEAVGDHRRQLSPAGEAMALEFAQVDLAIKHAERPADLPPNVEFIGDQLLVVLFEEDGHTFHVTVTADYDED